MFWYKQKLGQTLQLVGTVIAHLQPIIVPKFDPSRISLETKPSSVSLTLKRTTEDDEGIYFCGKSDGNAIQFSSGTFLAVTGHPKLSVSVLQTPVWGSVSPGELVTLQCTVLSEIRAAELRVLWFRAAAGQSFPEIIYTHQNSSSRQCEISSSTHSCVYNFSKNILDHNHTGTYYCAVAACGEIIFGNGASVELNHQPVLVVTLAVALALFSIGNITLVYWSCRRESCSGNTS
ncbi:uncharacterized protein LOC118806534 [Colossoma macropomum]|uniref:uncharacterized protein LOC118806534 n=1 Tax=Colossoma macropomum TaxID=42526 RepID=UPI001864BB49|nr:uncharacterized protein LOC118806534 [Colossoma macropomum]